MSAKKLLILATFLLTLQSPVAADTSFDPVTGIREFEGCVYDKTTQKKVKGATIQVWAPRGGGYFTSTGIDGCFRGGGVGYSSASGGFIEASATIKNRHYRQQYLLPPNLDSDGVGVDYHYDFFLDTFPRK